MTNVVTFKKPFSLARREDINPDVAAEWVKQAGVWLDDPNTTDHQKDLAQSVMEQWGIK